MGYKTEINTLNYNTILKALRIRCIMLIVVKAYNMDTVIDDSFHSIKLYQLP